MPPESVWVDVENGVMYWKETEIDKESGGAYTYMYAYVYIYIYMYVYTYILYTYAHICV